MRTFTIVFLIITSKLYGSDTIKAKFLYYPFLKNNYSLHDYTRIVYDLEYFYLLNEKNTIIKGFGIHNRFIFDSINLFFDSTNCLEENKVIFFNKSFNKYYKKHFLKNTIKNSKYLGLVFYAFEIELIIDSTQRPLYILDLKNKKNNMNFVKYNKEIPQIVKFIKITPLPLRKKKLRKNGKVYPIK